MQISGGPAFMHNYKRDPSMGQGLQQLAGEQHGKMQTLKFNNFYTFLFAFEVNIHNPKGKLVQKMIRIS